MATRATPWWLMAELTPEQRAALWKAGKLDVDQHNQNQSAQERTPVDPQMLAKQKERQDRIDKQLKANKVEYIAILIDLAFSC